MNRTRLSIPLVAVIAAAAIAAVVATSGGSTKKAQPAVAANSSISVERTAVGKALADANGRTLYLFAADKPNVSTLSAAGRAFWPRFTSTARPAAGGGARAGEIGVVAGATGAGQVSYNGHALYYFVGDHKPGETAGQGLNQFGARWYVLSSAGGAITSAPQSVAPSTPPGRGSGSTYGY